MLPHLALALAPLASPAQDDTWTLDEIQITRHDIYPDSTSWLARIVDGTHWTTRESVIRREIWKDPGDRVDTKFAEELERNLRALGLFADATVELVPDPENPARADLVVRTRDRLSISGGASASFVGDVASGGVSLGESNFLGMGDRIRFSFFENDLGESRGVLSYRDQYVAGTWTTGAVDVGRTDDGDFVGVRLTRPFRYLADRFSWSANARRAEVDADYFRLGENVAEAPFRETTLGADATWRYGTRERFATYGLVARHSTREFMRATGAAAASIRVPGDTDSTFVGPAVSFTNIDEFRKATHLDTLEFVQDIQVGTFASLEIGATARDEDGAESSVQPTAAARIERTWAFGDSTFASVRADGSARTRAGDAVGWLAGTDLRLFERVTRRHTLAIGASYLEADETQGLPVQLTLGEDSGLRGYPAREFTGQRLVRLNVEDRIDLGLRAGTFDIGGVVFFDAGWATARGADLGDPFTSVGFGLRIGSNELFGRGVVRLDVSFPLDEFAGQSYDPLVSISLGQVFGL